MLILAKSILAFMIGFILTSAAVMQGAAEILAYGTGVILEDE